jgi:hypothetical protein
MTTDYRSSSSYYDKISHVFIDPVRIVDDIVNFTDTIVDGGTDLNAATPTQITLPAGCEIFLVRHVTGSDIVWIGADNSVAAGDTNAWPLRPEDPPLKIRVANNTTLWGITSVGNATLHVVGMLKV